MPLPGLGTIGGLGERPEGGHESWFGYTDFATPSSVLHFDATTGSLTSWAKAPGSVAVPPMHSQLVEYSSKDGTTIRMMLLSAAATPDRPRPTVLYGYGGFGLPLGPGYSAGILSWVEAGGVYAIAQLRGGGEEGEDWHRAGMLANKQNVFDDFHAAAERLVADGWTTTDQLAISGGSNGGLLVGAALTQRPDLYRAVVCSAPLLDMVRYELFGMGATWAEEYGAASDPEQLGWLLGVLAVPSCQRRNHLSGSAFHHLRRRHPGRHHARPQARGSPAACLHLRARNAPRAGASGEGRRTLEPRTLAQHRPDG